MASFSSQKNGVRRDKRQEICVLAAEGGDEGLSVFKTTRTLNLKHCVSLHYTVTLQPINGRLLSLPNRNYVPTLCQCHEH